MSGIKTLKDLPKGWTVSDIRRACKERRDEKAQEKARGTS